MFKGVLKYHTENIEEFTNKVMKNEEKNLKGDFESSLKKCLEVKKTPYPLIKKKPKRAAHPQTKVINKSVQPKNNVNQSNQNTGSLNSVDKVTKVNRNNFKGSSRNMSARNLSNNNSNTQRYSYNSNKYNNNAQINKKRMN